MARYGHRRHEPFGDALDAERPGLFPLAGRGGLFSDIELREGVRDAAATVTRCACGWAFEGTARDGRAAFAEHDCDRPKVATVRRRQRSGRERCGST